MSGTAKKSTSSQKKNQQCLTSKPATIIQNQNKRRLRSGENRVQLLPLPRRSSGSTSLYDVNGKIRGTQEDICDCFDKICFGCHFPCDKCKSPKCGPTCRVYRRYFYEEIELDGKIDVKKNPNVFK